MKLESLEDIEKLPSVLDVDEVSKRLIELVSVIRIKSVPALKGAQAINDLISYQGHSEDGISSLATQVVLEWTKETYNEENQELIEWHTANIVNLSRDKAIEFFRERLVTNITSFERNEIKECLAEIGVEI